MSANEVSTPNQLLSAEQREQLIDKLWQERIDRCNTDQDYLRGMVWDCMEFDKMTDEELLQDHEELFDEEFE